MDLQQYLTVPTIALIVSTFTLIFTGIGMLKKADESKVVSLNDQIVSLEKRVSACESGRAFLSEQNIYLMRKVLEFENKHAV